MDQGIFKISTKLLIAVCKQKKSHNSLWNQTITVHYAVMVPWNPFLIGHPVPRATSSDIGFFPDGMLQCSQGAAEARWRCRLAFNQLKVFGSIISSHHFPPHSSLERLQEQ